MSLAFEMRRRARYAVVPLLCTGALSYFGYHAVQGDRGFSAWVSLGRQIEQAELQLAKDQHETKQLELRVSLLRANGLSRDLLSERARQVLSVAHPDEIIILGE